MSRRLAILAVLLALCASARASGPMMILSIMGDTGGTTPSAYDTAIAVWWPSHTLSYSDAVNGLSPTNVGHGVTITDQGFIFNGVSGSFLDIGRPSQLEPGTNRYIALSAWICPTSAAAMGIVGKSYYGPDANGRYALSRKPAGDVEAVVQALGETHALSANGTATNGAWTHVVVTVDRTVGGKTTLWQNGTNAASINNGSAMASPSTYPMSLAAVHPFLIGSYGSPNSYLFKGSVDRVAMWIGNASGLTSNDVMQLYNLGRTP